ncbi:hypothetical protein SAMN05421764_1364 [Donghicola eburneus]|nr:hypothetical protein SAMN05421764_1364 [Donghicola eburneus]
MKGLATEIFPAALGIENAAHETGRFTTGEFDRFLPEKIEKMEDFFRLS